MPSLLGLGLVGSDIVLELQGEVDEMEGDTGKFFSIVGSCTFVILR